MNFRKNRPGKSSHPQEFPVAGGARLRYTLRLTGLLVKERLGGERTRSSTG